MPSSLNCLMRNTVLCLVALLTIALAGDFSRNAKAETPPLDVPYVPTPDAVVQRMLEMAETRADDFVIDLGSGDGRIVIAALRDWKVQSALGVDLDPLRIKEARDNARQANVLDRATFIQGDLFEMDFSRATVLTMYLLPSVNMRLRPIILEKMRPGTRVVSHAFNMGDWKPDQRDTVEESNIFLWIVPARVSGRWHLIAKDGKEMFLLLNQDFQEISGTAMMGDTNTALTETQLRGTEISFSIGTDRYVGTVRGDSIIPRDGSRDWHVQRH